MSKGACNGEEKRHAVIGRVRNASNALDTRPRPVARLSPVAAHLQLLRDFRKPTNHRPRTTRPGRRGFVPPTGRPARPPVRPLAGPHPAGPTPDRGRSRPKRAHRPTRPEIDRSGCPRIDAGDPASMILPPHGPKSRHRRPGPLPQISLDYCRLKV